MPSSYAAVFRLSPPLVAHSHTRLTIRSGQSHPGLQTQPQPARHRFESHHSRAIRPPDRAMGGSEPSVTVPRTPPPAIAWCYVVKCLFSRRTSTSGASGTNVSCGRVPRGPSSTKGRIKAESERSRQARGVPGVARCQTARARDSATNRPTIRHDAPSFWVILAGHFRARIDLPGEKYHLGSGLDQRDKATPAVSFKQLPAFPNFKKTTGVVF